jgi:hypothetical protein
MKNGIIYEPIARKKYEKRNKCFVNDNGLYIHQKYHYLGASSDGVVFDINDK